MVCIFIFCFSLGSSKETQVDLEGEEEGAQDGAQQLWTDSESQRSMGRLTEVGAVYLCLSVQHDLPWQSATWLYSR